MNKNTKIIVIVMVLLLITTAFILFFYRSTQNSLEVNTDNTSVTITVIPTVSISPTSTKSSSKYTPEFRVKARSAFIVSCLKKVGQQYTTACECGADYLATHYSDAQLEKVYLEYHSGNKTPTEIQAAYTACKDK